MALALAAFAGCSALQPSSQAQKCRIVSLDIKVKQTLGPHSALALTKGSGIYYYIGDMVKVVSETDLMYDDLVIKGRFVLVDTYTYTTADESVKTVPVYISHSEYKKILDSGRDINAVVSLLNR